MALTASASWLNTFFAGYDAAILGLLHRLAELAGLVLTPLMKLITLLGEKGLILILIAVVLMLFSRTRKIGVCMFGAIACGAILTNFILKDWVARPRPFETVDLFRQWWQAVGSPAEDGFSFPSGHVTAAAAGMTALCFTRGRRWILPSVLWVLLMAVSRNYLMAHYPSDVLFAVLIGLVAAVIAYLITLLIFRLLEDHADLPFCALLLGFNLPLRLPTAPASQRLNPDCKPEKRPQGRTEVASCSGKRDHQLKQKSRADTAPGRRTLRFCAASHGGIGPPSPSLSLRRCRKRYGPAHRANVLFSPPGCSVPIWQAGSPAAC